MRMRSGGPGHLLMHSSSSRGELGGIGRSHHIAGLRDEAVGGAVAGNWSNGCPVIVMGSVVPVCEHFAHFGLPGCAHPVREDCASDAMC